MDNKLLITGLGIGQALNVCQVCGMNYSWLYENPSTLIWADEICIPRDAIKHQNGRDCDKLDKSINLVMDKMLAAGVISPIDIKDTYQDHVGSEIIQEVERDLLDITKLYPNSVSEGEKGVPDSIKIDNYDYCIPYISSIYASLLVARDINATCLFSERERNYLKYKMGISYGEATKTNSSAIYNEIFTALIPNDVLMPGYALTPDEKCNTCEHTLRCSDSYLQDLETSLDEILKLRDYDEINVAKEVLGKIVDQLGTIDSRVSIDEIKREFISKQKKISSMMSKRFPQIKRWSSIVAICALPMSIISASSGDRTAATIYASALAASKAADILLDYYSNRHKWIGLFSKSVKKTSRMGNQRP